MKQNHELYQIQSDYVNGVGVHGPVLQKYAALLDQYKEIFVKCPPFKAESPWLINFVKEGFPDDNLKRDMILILIVFILRLISPSFVMTAILSVVLGCLKYFWEDEKKWALYYVAACFFCSGILSFLPYQYPGKTTGVFCYIAIWGLLMAPLAIQAADKYLSQKNMKQTAEMTQQRNKEMVAMQRHTEEGLDNLRAQMKALLPQLRQEYEALFEKKAANFSDQEVWKEKYGRLPEKFWWEVTSFDLYWEEREWRQEQLNPIVRELGTQEIKGFIRNTGFEAGSEYAPLYAASLTEAEMKERYQANLKKIKQNGGIVIDFVDCIQYSDVVSTWETTEVYDRSWSERMEKKGEWEGIGKKIVNKYEEGELSYQKARDLAWEYDQADPGVKAAINSTHSELSRSSRLQTIQKYAWTGQALLVPDRQSGDNTWILVDYRSRPEYMYDNLNEMQMYRITKLENDHLEENVDMVAKLQQMFLLSPAFNVENSAINVENPLTKKKTIPINVWTLLSFACVFIVPEIGIVLGAIGQKREGGKLARWGILLNIARIFLRMTVR